MKRYKAEIIGLPMRSVEQKLNERASEGWQVLTMEYIPDGAFAIVYEQECKSYDLVAELRQHLEMVVGSGH